MQLDFFNHNRTVSGHDCACIDIDISVISGMCLALCGGRGCGYVTLGWWCMVVGIVANVHMTWAPLGRKLTCTDTDEAGEGWLPGAVPYPPAVRWPLGLTQPQSPNSWDSLTMSTSTEGGCPLLSR